MLFSCVINIKCVCFVLGLFKSIWLKCCENFFFFVFFRNIILMGIVGIFCLLFFKYKLIVFLIEDVVSVSSF